MRDPRFPTVVLCEYLARDTYGKHLLAGVYSGDILVGALPAELRVTIYAEFVAPTDGDHKIELIFRLGDKDIVKAEILAAGVRAGTMAVLSVPGLGFMASDETTLSVFATVNQEAPVVLVQKKISKAPPSHPIATGLPF